MKVEGTDFAVVFVTDYPRAVEFYGATLGLGDVRDYGKIPGGEFETGNLTLTVLDAAAVGREFEPSGSPIALRVDDVEAARAELEGAGRRVPRRDDGLRRLPAGAVQGPGRQRPDPAPPLRAALSRRPIPRGSRRRRRRPGPPSRGPGGRGAARVRSASRLASTSPSSASSFASRLVQRLHPGGGDDDDVAAAVARVALPFDVAVLVELVEQQHAVVRVDHQRRARAPAAGSPRCWRGVRA